MSLSTLNPLSPALLINPQVIKLDPEDFTSLSKWKRFYELNSPLYGSAGAEIKSDKARTTRPFTHRPEFAAGVRIKYNSEEENYKYKLILENYTKTEADHKEKSKYLCVALMSSLEASFQSIVMQEANFNTFFDELRSYDLYKLIITKFIDAKPVPNIEELWQQISKTSPDGNIKPLHLFLDEFKNLVKAVNEHKRQVGEAPLSNEALATKLHSCLPPRRHANVTDEWDIHGRIFTSWDVHLANLLKSEKVVARGDEYNSNSSAASRDSSAAMRITIENDLCFNCGLRGHKSNECSTAKQSCSVPGCEYNHSHCTSMHVASTEFYRSKKNNQKDKTVNKAGGKYPKGGSKRDKNFRPKGKGDKQPHKSVNKQQEK